MWHDVYSAYMAKYGIGDAREVDRLNPIHFWKLVPSLADLITDPNPDDEKAYLKNVISLQHAARAKQARERTQQAGA